MPIEKKLLPNSFKLLVKRSPGHHESSASGAAGHDCVAIYEAAVIFSDGSYCVDVPG